MAMPASPSTNDVFTIERAEQLKALGHPLRLRVLEMLGDEGGEPLTNRELAQKLDVDPGHLHFHVRMLLRAGLIERADGGRGREKPYRAVARTVRIPPELLASAPSHNVQAAMLSEVERGWATYSGEGRFRSVQLTVRLDHQRALELMTEFAERLQELEDPKAEPTVVTMVAHPPTSHASGNA